MALGVALFTLAAAGCAGDGAGFRRADLTDAGGDPFDILLGKWEGTWQWDPYMNQGTKEDLVLVIRSVWGTGSSRDVRGGLTHMRRGSPMYNNVPMSGTAELGAGRVVVTLATSWNYRMTLGLNGDLLLGTGRLGSAPVSPHDSRVTLQRAVPLYPDVMVRRLPSGLVGALPPAVPIPDVQSLAGTWRGVELRDTGVSGIFLFIDGTSDLKLFVEYEEYKLKARVEDGKVSWRYHTRSGSLTLHEGDGKRILRMATGGSVTADYVFDGQ